MGYSVVALEKVILVSVVGGDVCSPPATSCDARVWFDFLFPLSFWCQLHVLYVVVSDPTRDRPLNIIFAHNILVVVV